MDTQDTSRAAYDRMRPEFSSMEAEVHLWLLGRGPQGGTCDEAEIALRMRHQTCSARFYDLRRKGKIVDSRTRRMTSSGHAAIVWLAVRKPDAI
jgi:hypothetical protein